MELFDSVYLDCPGCNTSLELQSKAAEGGPRMKVFSRDEVPATVAVDLNNEEIYCPNCGKTWKAQAKKLKPIYRMRLVEKSSDEEDDDA